MSAALLTLLLDLARTTDPRTHAPFIVELMHDVVLDVLDNPPTTPSEALQLVRTLQDLKSHTRKATR